VRAGLLLAGLAWEIRDPTLCNKFLNPGLAIILGLGAMREQVGSAPCVAFKCASLDLVIHICVTAPAARTVRPHKLFRQYPTCSLSGGYDRRAHSLDTSTDIRKDSDFSGLRSLGRDSPWGMAGRSIRRT
jgi:hypothetical protein